MRHYSCVQTVEGHPFGLLVTLATGPGWVWWAGAAGPPVLPRNTSLAPLLFMSLKWQRKTVKRVWEPGEGSPSCDDDPDSKASATR